MSGRDAPRAHAGVAEARRVVRNTSLQLIAEVLGKGLMLVLYAVMARELGPGGFGNFTFGISVVIIIELGGVGVDVTLARETAKHPNRAASLAWNGQWLKIALGLAGGVVVAAIALLGDDSGQTQLMLAVIALGKFVEMSTYTIFAIFRGFEDARPVATGILIQRFSFSVVGIVGLLAFGFGVVAIAVVYCAASLLTLGFAALRLDRYVELWPPRLSRLHGNQLFKASVAIGIGSVFGAFLARADAVLLSFFEPSAVVGAYGAAYRLFEGTLFVSFAFGVAVLPLIARLGPTTTPSVKSVVGVALKAISMLLFPIGLGITLFADPLVDAVFGPDFAGAVGATRWLGVSVALYGIFVVGIYVLAARDRQGQIPWLMASLAVFNIALNLVLIPEFAASGAAAAMTITQVVATVVTLLLAARAVNGFSPSRAFLGPVAGALGMIAVVIILGPTALSLLASLLAFALVAGSIELSLFRHDVRLGLRAISLRSTAGPIDFTPPEL
jgi:O-antigen/teichoic acid export membrane protein